MRLRPPRSTRTYTLFPYPPLFRSRRHMLFALVCLPLRACRRAALTCRKSHESREVVSQFRGNPITHDIARSCSALDCPRNTAGLGKRSEEHTSELQSLMRISYAVFCLKKKKNTRNKDQYSTK